MSTPELPLCRYFRKSHHVGLRTSKPAHEKGFGGKKCVSQQREPVNVPPVVESVLDIRGPGKVLPSAVWEEAVIFGHGGHCAEGSVYTLLGVSSNKSVSDFTDSVLLKDLH